jgi:L-alanine-DL-glutamate epimerase-like enolase superfamily enzyme
MHANAKMPGPMALSVELERWPLKEPFRISGYTFEAVEVLVVTLGKGGHVGRGEAAGVYYKKDVPRAMLDQVVSMRATIESGIDRLTLQTKMRPGGARNALDCALWELEAKLAGSSVSALAGLPEARSLLTTFTCGADTPEKMVAVARAYPGARAIKLKLTGEPIDADRVCAVREALPDVLLTVDANQGFNRSTLEQLLPTLVNARVALIEQPFAVGNESLLDGLQSPIRVVADESVQGVEDMSALVGRFDAVNIKLDKCGGLTEGLAMVRAARDLGLDTMVGNMLGTSLAMAPAYVLARVCSLADLDGPVFLAHDRSPRVEYADGRITCSRHVWG